MRPAPGYADYRTPIAGLYQAGSATHGGGGVTGIPGLKVVRRSPTTAAPGASTCRADREPPAEADRFLGPRPRPSPRRPAGGPVERAQRANGPSGRERNKMERAQRANGATPAAVHGRSRRNECGGSGPERSEWGPRGAVAMSVDGANAVLSVRDLHVTYRGAGGGVPAVRGGQPRRAPGRDGGRGGGVRLRQVDDGHGPAPAAARPARRPKARSSSTATTCWP